jgi:hypothetical protein
MHCATSFTLPPAAIVRLSHCMGGAHDYPFANSEYPTTLPKVFLIIFLSTQQHTVLCTSSSTRLARILVFHIVCGILALVLLCDFPNLALCDYPYAQPPSPRSRSLKSVRLRRPFDRVHRAQHWMGRGPRLQRQTTEKRSSTSMSQGTLPSMSFFSACRLTIRTNRDDETLAHYDRRFFHGVASDEERTDTQSHMVRAYLNFFREKKMDTWIAHGTLLGWWWNGKVASTCR